MAKIREKMANKIKKSKQKILEINEEKKCRKKISGKNGQKYEEKRQNNEEKL